ncbi:PucR family transcriptional regulator [Nocardiopsis algeriensis]|nr:PucR family transcriptional regulator [Nocardiopsis algeriensis]
MRIGDLLAVERLDLRFLVGEELADREVEWVYTTDLLEPARYLRGGGLVLTGMMWRTCAEDSRTFVASVVSAGSVALGAGTALGEVPPDLVEACREFGLPLLEVPAQTAFGAVTEEVLRARTRERLTTMARSRDRSRRLMAQVASGADFAKVFAESAGQAGLRAWVVSGSGRDVAGSGGVLAQDDREWLAAQALGWSEFPRTVRLGGGRGAVVTVLAVQGARTCAQARWLLVCEGEPDTWGEELGEAVAELGAVAEVARSRAEERVVTAARHLEGLSRLLAAQRLEEAAALVRGVGGSVDAAVVVVSAAVLPGPVEEGSVLGVVAELVAGFAGAVVARDGGGGDVLALVPEGDAERVRGEVVRRCGVLEAGMAERRLALGTSASVRGVGELRAAAVEARHARRLAELRGGRCRVIAGSEIDSHELLLASVPEEVQVSYRERLLGPLLEYDRDHRSELVETLERFLEHSGSWQRCAAAMHVHVNTLRYRIGRVEELTGRDLSTLEHRVDLFLALKLRD